MNVKSSLGACPSSPNCVSSQSDSEKHNIAPISYNGSVEHAYAIIIKVLNSMKGTQIVKQDRDYIHAECKTKWVKSTNDVEFAFDLEKKVIDVRSASRTGFSDFGANRKRVEQIRRRFIQEV